MLRKSFLFFTMFIMCLCLQAAELPLLAVENSSVNTYVEISDVEYHIGVGDVLEISVWGYDELTRQVMVRPDGKISYILAGDVIAKGQTITLLSLMIENRILDYIKKPKVTIILQKIGDRRIFIIGDVKLSGSYELGEGEGLLEVLSSAGGFTKEAELNIVKIFHKNSSKVDVINFNKILDSKDHNKNILLQPGDVIYVPRTGLGQVSSVASQFLPPFQILYYLYYVVGQIMGLP
jgi:polysaccharide biosynthesis/export protein